MDEADSFGSSKIVRTTQRTPRSCIPCSRRKIKCSKTVPCDACTRRGEILSCTREVVRVNGKITVAVDPDPSVNIPGSFEGVLNENSALRDRVKQLESLLAQDFESCPGLTTAKQQLGLSRANEDIRDTFDNLHLGLQPEVLTPGTPLASDSLHKVPNLLSLLPIRKSSEKIVRFSLNMLGWIHCALNPRAFILEHDKFWSALEGHDRTVLSNHTWIAVYMSVLAVGAYFMDSEDASELHYLHEGFSGHSTPTSAPALGSMMQISRAWYDMAFQELDLVDYLSKPNLCTVQTLAICMLLHRNFGQPDRDYVLLGVAINVARALGMDRLGSEDTCPKQLKARPEWVERGSREVGRRLWWTLVICDWMTVFSRPASISSRSFTTVLSIDEDNSRTDAIATTLETEATMANPSPSALHYHLIMSKIAYIIYVQVKNADGRSTASICRALQAINSIAHNLPTHLTLNDQNPLQLLQDNIWPWMPVQRNSLDSVLQACRINICLAYFPQYLDTGEDKFCIHDRGLDAARNAIEQRQFAASLQIFSKLWGVSATILAAGIYLALDLICFKDSKPQHAQDATHKLIEYCVSSFVHGEGVLVLADARSTILKRLLYLRAMWTENQPVDKGTIAKILDAVATASTSSFDGGIITLASPRIRKGDSLQSDPGDMLNFGFGSTDTFDSVATSLSMNFESMEQNDIYNEDFQLSMLHSGLFDPYEQQHFEQFWNTGFVE